ncbi:MAG: GGDEF domain-containing protein, partial [Vicinamibacterales bacterium]
GHPTGDIVLREVGSRLGAAVRGTDLSARIGGDEFALVLVDTSAADAAVKLEEIRSAVATRVIPTRDGSGVDITLSAGVAVYPGDGEDTDALVSAADARLLVAKQRGRNCLVVSAAETPAPRRPSGAGSWKL